MFDLPHTNNVVRIAAVSKNMPWWLAFFGIPVATRWRALWATKTNYSCSKGGSKQAVLLFPSFRGGKIHLHSRGLTLLARGSIGSSKNEWGNGAVPHRPSVQYVVVVVVVTILVYYTTRFWNPHTTQRSSIGATGNRALKCPWRLLLRKTSEEEYT